MNQQIYEEASEWLVEFRAGRPDRATRERFERWLSASPEHVRAYLEQAAIWEAVSTKRVAVPADGGSQTGRVAQLATPVDIEALIERGRQSSGANVVTLAPLSTTAPSGTSRVTATSDGATAANPGAAAEDQGATAADHGATSADTRATRKRPRHSALWATAATLLLSVLVASFYFLEPRNTYTTAVGEQRSILLPDGSTIDLNARSKVRVRFSEQGRHVDLLEGQALFRVAKDKARPFIVAVNGTRVRAVGTQFDINQRKRGVVVTVVEGTVAVSGRAAAAPPGTDRSAGQPAQLPASPSAPASTSTTASTRPHSAISAETGEILLDAGQQMTVSPAASTANSVDAQSSPHRVDVDIATAWTRRRLVFETTPLEDVAAEFNRNSERVLVIEGNGLDDFHVSGAFSSTDVEPFLRFLRAQNGVAVIEEPDRIVITHR